jgi:hypothetical protein
MTHHQNAGQNCNIKIIIKCFKKCGELKDWGIRVTNKNYI